ncbi:hypothetical protein ACFV0T_26215 [Streptomyces sp. NPDC059582]|uniref:hypothetical protein n=1 Tax=Streptomyces sp. NPDC059582 TaxID=3346875 RepID=UPI0036C1E698
MPDLTYKGLQASTTALAKDIARSAEAIRKESQAIDDEAKDTGRQADGIASLRVDNTTVSETRDLAKIMAGLSDAVIAYASAGDTTARHAQAAHQQNHDSHDRIHEAVRRSPVGRDIYDVNRAWVNPE